MKPIIIYQADDNTVFQTKNECLKYEANLRFLQHITSLCNTTVSAHVDFEIYTEQNILNYIMRYWDDINILRRNILNIQEIDDTHN